MNDESSCSSATLPSRNVSAGRLLQGPSAQPATAGRAAAHAVLTILTLAVFWLIAGRSTPQHSERFYLVVPWVYAAGALWLGLLVGRRAALQRGLIAGAAIGGVLCVHLYERHYGAGGGLVEDELTVIAWMLLAVVLVARWIYLATWAVVRRALRVQPASSRRRVVGARLAAIFAYSFLLIAYLMAVGQTHFPKRHPAYTPQNLRLAYDDVGFASRDGTMLAGWFVPVDGSNRSAIVCHGVGAFKADMIDFIHALTAGGYNVLAFDFRGHGESQGHTASYGAKEKEDVWAAIDWLRAHHPAQSERIVGVAWSMGAASLIFAAAEDERIEALHIDAAYARTRDIAGVIAGQFPPVYRHVGKYLGLAAASVETGTNLFTLAPVDVIGQLAPRPILIVHGEDDRLIPIEQGRMLYAAAGEPKEFVAIPGCGHCGTIGTDTPEYQRRMLAFLNAALAAER
jgi:fermentation-respiration switch protein FrsA (DUF1100 family)